MITHILDKSQSTNVKTFNAKIASLDPTIRHVITIKTFSEKRSDLQNRLSFSWYNELAEHFKDDTATGYRCFCKLNFGVVIMRTEDAEFRSIYDTAIKGLTYEQKIKIMEILPVTSLMSTKQLTQYLDNMKAYFYDNHGFDLKYPMDY